MRAFLDTNVVVRYFTRDPPEQADAAERFLRDAEELWVADLIVAEVVYVLRRVYRIPRPVVASGLRSMLGVRNIVTNNPALLLRAIEIYETRRLAFADAYIAAAAEMSGAGTVASFDKGLDRLGTVKRVEPA
ncbi:MAG: PIN domain-containing protein [Streptosporangiales bacterium]|nr:PIN domain-containing protein [Streptosporangiales bacterium]